MASNDVKLMGAWPSPFVNRVQIALALKSIDYEFIEEDFFKKSELLLKSNPVHKKVPVLIHGDKPISESWIILQYIDEFWKSGPPIFPSDPYERAMARFWTAYLDEKLFPAVRIILREEEGEAKAAAIEQVVEAVMKMEEEFSKSSRSSGKDFFSGDEIGYLDISFGCFLSWLKVTEQMNNLKLIDEAKTPALFLWEKKFSSQNAAKAVMPETEKLLHYTETLIPIMRAYKL